MARVSKVERCRKSPGKCGKCGKAIPKGAAYLHWAFRYGGKRIRCVACPRPRPSETTANDKLSQLYTACESVEDAISAFGKSQDVEELRGAVENAAGDVSEVAEAYREAASNIEQYFQSSEQAEQFNQNAEGLDSKADEMETAASELVEFDEDATIKEAEDEVDESEEGDNETIEEGDKAARVKTLVSEKKKEWAEEQVSLVEEFTDIDVEG